MRRGEQSTNVYAKSNAVRASNRDLSFSATLACLSTDFGRWALPCTPTNEGLSYSDRRYPSGSNNRPMIATIHMYTLALLYTSAEAKLVS